MFGECWLDETQKKILNFLLNQTYPTLQICTLLKCTWNFLFLSLFCKRNWKFSNEKNKGFPFNIYAPGSGEKVAYYLVPKIFITIKRLCVVCVGVQKKNFRLLFNGAYITIYFDSTL